MRMRGWVLAADTRNERAAREGFGAIRTYELSLHGSTIHQQLVWRQARLVHAKLVADPSARACDEALEALGGVDHMVNLLSGTLSRKRQGGRR